MVSWLFQQCCSGILSTFFIGLLAYKDYFSRLNFTGCKSISQSVLHLGEQGVGEKILKCGMANKGIPGS
jgi:hypothetical protein